MLNIILPFFTFFIIVFIFKLFIERNSNKNKKVIHSFSEDEFKASFSRSKDIPEELFYKPNINKLPFKKYDDINKYDNIIKAQEKILKIYKNKMLLLDPPIDNRNIKLLYGHKNLENIIRYEENYIKFIRALNNWANILIDLEKYKDAEIILLECINMKSLIFSSYSLLVSIYKKNGDINNIINLKNKINKIEFFQYDIFFKNKLYKFLNEEINKFLNN